MGYHGGTGGIGNTCGNLYAAVRNDGSGKQFARLFRSGDCICSFILRVLLGAVGFFRDDLQAYGKKDRGRQRVLGYQRRVTADSVRNLRPDCMVNVMRIA